MRVATLFSGGMDSTSLLAHLLAEGHEPYPVLVDYGQRHRVELEHAHLVAADLGLEPVTANLSTLRGILGGSSQTSDDVDVPEGHYTDESMRATVVPNRNLLMLSVAAALAVSRGLEAVAYAAHAGDHPIYPDCRPAFADAAAEAIRLGTGGVELLRPFIRMSKAEICRVGFDLGAPLHLTWSCYQGTPPSHCGKCGTCVERREAFELAGVPDPTRWANEEFPPVLRGPVT